MSRRLKTPDGMLTKDAKNKIRRASDSRCFSMSSGVEDFLIKTSSLTENRIYDDFSKVNISERKSEWKRR